MKVILLSDVESLGKIGDVVNVKDGFARNYLFPKQLAIGETKESLKVLEARKKRHAQDIAKERAKCDELAKKINSMSFTISAAAGEEDKLFGSVTAEDIRDALLAEDIQIDKKQLHLKEPIKKLGIYQVEIRLHPEITTIAKVWVVKK